MFKRTLLAAALVCFATPVLAASPELEFAPGTSPEAKFAWAKLKYPALCDAPMPDEIKNIKFENLPGEVVGIISSMTKQAITDFIKNKCNSQPSMAVVQN